MKIISYLSVILIVLSCSKNPAQSKNDSSMKYFETTNFKNLNDNYISKDISINGNKINIDLNFENNQPTTEELENLNKFLNKLSKIIEANDDKTKSEFKSPNENSVKDYITHHLSEISNPELQQLIDTKDKSKTDVVKLLEKLRLKRVGIYPQDNNQYSVFDYTIGEELTQYLIVIFTDKEGKIIDVAMES